MYVHVVRFLSSLPAYRIRGMLADRAPSHVALPGLAQLYCLRYATGGYEALYVWDSAQSMYAFRTSDLSRSIHDAYRPGNSTVDVADVVFALRPPGGGGGGGH